MPWVRICLYRAVLNTATTPSSEWKKEFQHGFVSTLNGVRLLALGYTSGVECCPAGVIWSRETEILAPRIAVRLLTLFGRT